jgi:hypothetical protein
VRPYTSTQEIAAATATRDTVATEVQAISSGGGPIVRTVGAAGNVAGIHGLLLAFGQG